MGKGITCQTSKGLRFTLMLDHGDVEPEKLDEYALIAFEDTCHEANIDPNSVSYHELVGFENVAALVAAHPEIKTCSMICYLDNNYVGFFADEDQAVAARNRHNASQPQTATALKLRITSNTRSGLEFVALL